MGVIAILTVLSVVGMTLTQADCGNHGNCYNVGEIALNVDVDDDTISVTWKVNSTDLIHGYKVIVKDSDDTYIYESPILDKHAESMDVKKEIDSGNYRVCVVVLLNETESITEKCKQVKVSDLQMVVGILAGVVFLVPCMAALSYIIYKDRQVVQRPVQDDNETKILIKRDIEAMVDDEKPRASKSMGGEVNKCFEADNDSVKSENETGPEKSEASIVIQADLAGSQVDASKSETAQQTVVKEKNETQSTVDKDIADAGTEQADGEKKPSKESRIFVIRL